MSELNAGPNQGKSFFAPNLLKRHFSAIRERKPRKDGQNTIDVGRSEI